MLYIKSTNLLNNDTLYKRFFTVKGIKNIDDKNNYDNVPARMIHMRWNSYKRWKGVAQEREIFKCLFHGFFRA